MKAVISILTIALFLAIACTEDDDHPDAMSTEDQIALNGMIDAFSNASHYNDSLHLCDQKVISCDQTQMTYFDNMFHYHDSLFHYHNGMYSHGNSDDDHEHDMQGSILLHGHMGGNSHGQGLIHTSNDHEEMESLRNDHLMFH